MPSLLTVHIGYPSRSLKVKGRLRRELNMSKRPALAREPQSTLPTTNYWLSTAAKGSLLNDRVDVALFDDEELFPIELNFLAGVLAVEHLIADFNVHRDGFAIVGDAAGANGHDFTLIGLLFGGVRQNDTALGFLFLGQGLNDYSF